MKYFFLWPLCSLVMLAQAPPRPSINNPTESSSLTLRINVNLIQVDAVVTDSQNRPVTGLQPRDFEIFQDGIPQPITNFSYVDENRSAAPAKPASNPNELAPSHALGPAQVRRVLAFVVDDLGLSFDSIVYVRLALKQFVDEQMHPGDLVAIFRTGAGIGALQQFSSDKRLLYAAIDRIKFNAFGRVGISSFEPVQSLNGKTETGDRSPSRAVGGTGQGTPENDHSLQVGYVAGSLGAIRYVVEGLRDFPGRKSVILFSDDMPMGTRPEVIEGLRRLADAAERSSVVIHTVDARGLGIIRSAANYWRSQDGMTFLAHETGGLFLHDRNDLPATVEQVIKDSSAYYLIGYHPSPGTFDPSTRPLTFHSFKVRVRRAGLTVRTRGGFFGFSDREQEPVPATRESQMSRALASPFAAPDLPLRLTTLFTQQTAGSFVTTLLHTDAQGITFRPEPDGSYVGSVDLMAALFGDNGQIVGYGDHTYTLRVKREDYDAVLQNGFVFTETHRVKQPGAYQLRLALRDAYTQKVGSASQFVEIPDVTKGHLALSGVLLRKSGGEAHSTVVVTGQSAASDAKGNEAVRIFGPGAVISYAYEVMNAVSTRDAPPQLFEQIRVYRQSRLIHESAPARLELRGQDHADNFMAGGLVRLGPQFAPGDYILQVVVTDKLAKKKQYRSATQWIDFAVE